MTAKLTNRQKQALRTKNKIFDVTVELISENGFSNVNIEDICKAADVSVGTFYNYYKSKNEVFYELYSRADDFFKDKVDDSLHTADTMESILEYFDCYSVYCMKTGVHTMTQMMNASNKNFNITGRYMQGLLIDIFQRGLDNGNIKSEKSAIELCDFYFIIARGVLFDWCLHDGIYDLKHKIRESLSSIKIL